MALKFLSSHTPGSGSSKDVKVFEIRLDSNYVVLRGAEDEAASASLSGCVVLCLAEALMIHHVKLTLSGVVHMSYYTASTSAVTARRTAYKEKTFYEKTWTFRDVGKSRSELLPKDNYEWPFEAVIDGALPESVEGSREAWVVYKLKAEICRKRGKDLVVRKPLRIVRTIGATDLELSHAMSVENVWPNKIEYSISTPTKAIVFGSFLQVDFKLIPLLKGLVIGNIATHLKEEQEFMVDPDWGVPALNGGVMKQDRVIAWDNYELKNADEQIVDESAEGYQFSRYLELPKTLNQCLQDCNVKGIKVRHKVKFVVQLHNPDGHISELRANLPVSLYISPSLPLNDNNDLVDQTPQASRAALHNDLAHAAPPVYGQHTLDQLYSEVDLSGYRTPGQPLSTPGTPYSQSRNISSENLASLDAITSSPNHISVAALQNRLHDLRMSDRTTPGAVPHDEQSQPRNGDLSRRSSYHNATNGDYFSSSTHTGNHLDADGRRITPSGGNSGHSSRSESAQISRQSSAEDTRPSPFGAHSPPLLTDQYENLAKVPSYSTAMKTPAPRGVRRHDDLPSYGAVLSERQPENPAEPPRAHLHTARTGSWSGGIGSAAATSTARAHGDRSSDGSGALDNARDTRRRRSLAGRG